MVRLLLLLLVLIPPVNGAIDEEIYGENIVRIQRQAQIEWIRENKYTIYDFFSKKNKIVSSLSDEDIIEIMKNEYSLKKLNFDAVDLEPYYARIRARDAGKKQVKKEIEESRKIVRKRIPPKTKTKVDCVRKRVRTVYDPIWRNNVWLSGVSNRYLERILEIKKFEGC